MAEYYQSMIDTKINDLKLNHVDMTKAEIWNVILWAVEMREVNEDQEPWDIITGILPTRVFGQHLNDLYDEAYSWLVIRNQIVSRIGQTGFDYLEQEAFTLELSNNCRHGVMQDVERMVAEGATDVEVQKLIDATAEKILRNPEFFKL